MLLNGLGLSESYYDVGLLNSFACIIISLVSIKAFMIFVLGMKVSGVL